MRDSLKPTVLAYLRSQSTMAISTCNAGSPWAADVFYVNDGLTLYFLSDPKTRHCQDIAANPLVALTIHGEYRGWREIKGIQAEGLAQMVTDQQEHSKAWSLFLAKYPFVRDFYPNGLPLLAKLSHLSGGAVDEMARRLASVRIYRVATTRLFFIDNETGFGHKDEISP